jgi:hypothetical protein
MDMTVFIPRVYHRPLAFLGKRDWCKLSALGKHERLGTDACGINLEPLPPIQDAMQAGVDRTEYENTILLLKALAADRNSPQSSMLYMYALSKALTTGPKVFLPTVEQCRALANVTVDLSVSDYFQPYPVMLYIFPREYIDELCLEFHQTLRPAAMLSHKLDKGLLVGANFENHTQIMGTFISPDKLLEDSLKKKVMNRRGPGTGEEIDLVSFRTRQEMVAAGMDDDDLSDFDMTERIERLCMNLGLILAEYPVRVQPLNPKEYAKQSANLASKSHYRRELGEKFIVSEMHEIKLVQEIKFHEDQYLRKDGTISDGPPTGRLMPAHWRKGHWRRYRMERGWKQDHNVFIKPVRIHKEWDGGDTSGTQVTYKGY